ncbi:site-specific integrase [uncultured Rhodospira sp.]|uniref:tyrosine-type recombinase/integrase n=1 Tax=uncultured Rhodospira sp. TaxID=1936189 RepID=UPI002617AF45|nr:site-specific integrase [uncultured Rhodospira sp.]
MPKRAKGLTARQVQTLMEPGLYADGEGLYLQITKTGGKTWIYRFSLAGRRRDMGLGPASVLRLAEARERAREARALVAAGTDPIEARRALPINAGPAVPTFGAARVEYVEAKRAGWRNDKHAAQWSATLATYADPVIGEMPVDAVTTEQVLQCLTPIWTSKPETASRVRGRIESVLDYAKARGWRDGENPARWKGHLALTLPAKSKVRRVEGHASLPYRDMPALWPHIQAADGMGARALEFAILTAGRTGEVLGARWDEIDLAAETWTIPGERMKAGAEHRVPLSAPALALLRKMAAVRICPHVFPGQKAGRPLSNMAMKMTLKRMGREDITPHGFRSTFRTWAAEQTSTPHEVCEAALAHTQGNKVVAAYQRGDLLDRRRLLMDTWAAYVTSADHGDTVVSMVRPGS